MSEKADWQKRLLTELGDLLSPYGFKFVAARRAYQKETSSGWKSVHLALVQHPLDFDVVVNAAVRLESVQRVLDGDTDRRRQRATVGCEYGNLLGTGQHRWSVATEADVSPTAHAILTACQETLFQFLDRFSDLATVYSALKPNDKQARLLMPLEDKRRKIVDAAAELLAR